MIVNYEHKLIFHHVPKCAGSSIRYAMGNYQIKEFNGVINGKMISHPLANEIFENKIYKIDESFFIFSCIRNPYQRAISAYSQFLKEFKLKLSMEDYLQQIKNKEYLKDYRFIHGCPQYHFLFLNNRPIFDYIIRVESIYKDYEKLYTIKLNKLGRFIPLQKNNPSELKIKKNAIKSLTEDHIRKINVIYNIDFSTFNYDKLDI